MWPAIAAAFSFALIALGVIIYVATDYGRIKIIVDGPNADVQLDGDLIRIRTPRESISLRAGEHELTVKWRDGQFETRKFVVRRRDNEELRVEYEPKQSPAKPPAPPAAESISRTITDSMLVIKTDNGGIMDNAKLNFPLQVDRNIKATLRSDKVYINEVFGRKNVLCTHPLSPSSPGTMDFSRITSDRTGTLTLLVHGYPGPMPGGRIVVKSDGVMINDVIVRLRGRMEENRGALPTERDRGGTPRPRMEHGIPLRGLLDRQRADTDDEGHGRYDNPSRSRGRPRPSGAEDDHELARHDAQADSG